MAVEFTYFNPDLNRIVTEPLPHYECLDEAIKAGMAEKIEKIEEWRGTPYKKTTRIRAKSNLIFRGKFYKNEEDLMMPLVIRL